MNTIPSTHILKDGKPIKSREFAKLDSQPPKYRNRKDSLANARKREGNLIAGNLPAPEPENV